MTTIITILNMATLKHMEIKPKKSDNYGSEYNNYDDDYEYEDDPDGAIYSVGLDAEVREQLP